MLNRGALLLPALLTLCGCTFRPNILSATVSRTSETDATVHVKVAQTDAAVIRKNEFYFTIVVENCEGQPNRFPIQPMIAGQPATEFRFPMSEPDVEITGTIPEKILREYGRSCVFLEGGSYFKGKIKSNTVPLMKS